MLRVLAPCVARLSAIDLIAPFELGADRVAVIACKQDACAYPTADDLIQQRINYVKKFLDEIKTGGDNLRFAYTVGSAEESWADLWAQAKKDLEKVGS